MKDKLPNMPKRGVPADLRRAAKHAIKTGLNPEAIAAANAAADEINSRSIYENAVQDFINKPFEVI